MKLLKYSSNHESNINKFEKDIYIYLNLNSHNDDENILNYIDEFKNEFNRIYNFVKKLKNDINNLKYEYEFEISINLDKPTMLLNKISLINIDSIEIINIDDKIKKKDYTNMLKILDNNYIIKSNSYPYFIVDIIKTDNDNKYIDFYKDKYLILNNINLNKIFEIDFDNKLLYIFENDDKNKLQLKETYSFVINKNNIILLEGPFLQVEICLILNNIKLNNEIYFIDENSTIDIYETYNVFNLNYL